ncbi:hypothetical protein COBT_001423 [Conglomerata obtusa]
MTTDKKFSLKIKEGKERTIIYSNNSNDIYNDLKTTLEKIKIILKSNPLLVINNCNFKRKSTLYFFDKKPVFYNEQSYEITLVCVFKHHIYSYYKKYYGYYNIYDIDNPLNDKITCEKHQELPKKFYKNINKQTENTNMRFVNYGEFEMFKKDYVIVGQFNNEIIILGNEYNLILLDQHAIHERIRLEAYLKNMWEHNMNKHNFIEYAKEKACKGAIKFGTYLNSIQIHNLIIDLFKCKYPTICAHGRPSILIKNHANDILNIL